MSDCKEADFGRIPINWDVSTIEEITEFVTDYVANGSFASLAENVNYKQEPDYAYLIRLTDYNKNFQGDFVYVDEHAYNFLGKSKLFGGEVIISNVGAYAGTVFLAPILDKPMTLGPNAIMMNFSDGNSFYYYWLKSSIGQFLLDGIISGSAQPKFNKTAFRKMQVPVPPVKEQEAIASVLSCLDDKIDLLNRQNKTIEAMAETIFRQWFIEKVNDTWKKTRLGNYIKIKHGFAFKGEYINTEQNDQILVTPGNFQIGGGFKAGKMKYFHDTNYPDEYKFSSNDLIVTMTDLSKEGDTLGYPALVPLHNQDELVYLHNQRVGKVLFTKPISKYYIYFLMRSDEYQWEILGGASGTSVRHTSPSSIEAFEFTCPSEEKLTKFDNLVIPLMDKTQRNIIQINKLEKLRDTLIPKLMTGEVRVKYD